ncbi:MAG: hydrogenase accessory protein HypB, partial [Thauera sp.]|nr:hydrogenase accessory protein HypB [Thauera sp.]
MCTVCGCGGKAQVGLAHGGADGVRAKRAATKPTDAPHQWRALGNPAPATRPAGHQHLHFGAGPARAHVPGLGQTEMLRIERDILGKNDALAAHNRASLAARGILALNLV